jgi:hypothetical protein
LNQTVGDHVGVHSLQDNYFFNARRDWGIF